MLCMCCVLQRAHRRGGPVGADRCHQLEQRLALPGVPPCRVSSTNYLSKPHAAGGILKICNMYLPGAACGIRAVSRVPAANHNITAG